MRVPFPLTLNVGTDIIAHRRLLRPNAPSKHLQRLALRFLHPQELSQLNKRFPDWLQPEHLSVVQQTKLGTYLAGRWAAKEAAKKAWGANLLSFKDLRIETLPDGQVQVVCQSFDEKTSKITVSEEDTTSYEQTARLSISHDGDYAVATVIATPLHHKILEDLQARKAKAESRIAGLTLPADVLDHT